MGELTLYRLCLWKTALLLKNAWWNDAYERDGSRNNPFCRVPSLIVDDLLKCVLQLTSCGTLKVTDLYHLLTSGRVEHFKLYDILLSSEEFVSILMSLSVACQNLKSVTLRSVYFSDSYANLHKTKTAMKKAALECVLSISPNLEVVESCIEFDMKAIRNCERLRVLKINFPPKSRLYDFLIEHDGKFFNHDFLSVFEVFEDSRNPLSEIDLVPILQHCPALTQTNVDVSRALEHIHTDDLFSGELSARYNLQKCYFGSVNAPDGSTTILAVHIATSVFPLMTEIDVLASDDDVIIALNYFENLTSMLIQWDSPQGGDFLLGLQELLEKIGSKLKTLHIINFNNVDFACIATNCPVVEELKIEYSREYCGYDPPPEALKYLKSLHVENIDSQYGCCESTILMMLCNSTLLTLLHLHCAAFLNDSVLVQILQKNSLCYLKDAVILNSSLSGTGVRSLITKLKALEFFHFSSSQISFEEAAAIVHAINAHVIMRSDAE